MSNLTSPCKAKRYIDLYHIRDDKQSWAEWRQDDTEKGLKLSIIIEMQMKEEDIGMEVKEKKVKWAKEVPILS